MFKKSSRVSCCAPGGDWYKNCGGVGNKHVDHSWSEGAQACKFMATTTISSVCPKCGIIAKSGKVSCCGHSGSWFRNCGSAGNAKLGHTWYEGIQACKTWSQFKAVIGRQSNAAQQLNPSNGAGMANFTSVVIPTSTSTTSTNTIAPIATTATATTTAVSTVTTTTTVITTTMTIITHNSKEEAIATDWISQVVPGIIFT